jgi:2-amino-1-hydroxyethylphosphonate dioxygenase (glycine-forming)
MNKSETPVDAEQHINYIFQLLEEQGKGDYLGESISQLEHCLQAAYFASQEVDDSEAIIAALLHDIGQFLPRSEIRNSAAGEKMIDAASKGNVGRQGHDIIGQRWLLLHGWPQRVASLVGAHVTSKR